METPDLGSRRKRLLRRALRARRNRSLVSHLGCETHKERREAKDDLARHWTPTQRLHSFPRRITSREAGRPSGLSPLNGVSDRGESVAQVDRLLLKMPVRSPTRRGGLCTMTRTVDGGGNFRE